MENLKASQPSSYAKAIWTFFVTPLGQLAVLLVGDMSPADLTWGQWTVITFTTVVATGGVLGFENKPVQYTKEL